MKMLNGQELAGFIKERQAHQVRSLQHSHKITPKLVIIRTNSDPIVDSYMKLKTKYGKEVGVHVEVVQVEQAEAIKTIKKINKDPEVHGVIVQIPLPDPAQTTEVLNSVAPDKDVDGLGEKAQFDPATPVAINWLLAGYNVNLMSKNIVIIGNGRLVGKPLARIWKESGLDVKVLDKKSKDFNATVKEADVIVCATGVPGLITKDLVKDRMVIVDAGVATDNNGLVGDVAPEVRELSDITITPEKGGVGPLTVSALFENVLLSARRISEK